MAYARPPVRKAAVERKAFAQRWSLGVEDDTFFGLTVAVALQGNFHSSACQWAAAGTIVALMQDQRPEAQTHRR